MFCATTHTRLFIYLLSGVVLSSEEVHGAYVLLTHARALARVTQIHAFPWMQIGLRHGSVSYTYAGVLPPS